MASPPCILGPTYRHTDTQNWFEPSWDHGIKELVAGQWRVTTTPRNYIIVRGGPPLFHNHDPGESGSIKHHHIEQAINRDCLLGACVQAQVARVPLFSPEEIREPAHNVGGTRCTFALSLRRMLMPPFNFNEGSIELQSQYLIIQGAPGTELPMKTLDDGTREKYIDYIRSVIDGIVFPNEAVYGTLLKGWGLLNLQGGLVHGKNVLLSPFDCTFKYDPDYPAGYTRLYCHLGMAMDGRALTGAMVKMPTLEATIDPKKKSARRKAPPKKRARK